MSNLDFDEDRLRIPWRAGAVLAATVIAVLAIGVAVDRIRRHNIEMRQTKAILEELSRLPPLPVSAQQSRELCQSKALLDLLARHVRKIEASIGNANVALLCPMGEASYRLAGLQPLGSPAESFILKLSAEEDQYFLDLANEGNIQSASGWFATIGEESLWPKLRRWNRIGSENRVYYVPLRLAGLQPPYAVLIVYWMAYSAFDTD
ncbi:MAG: hypothetical protein K1X75_09135 [Leptospirales bacterium]|nr:hypothetical protein [Leptospirales bacterium]